MVRRCAPALLCAFAWAVAGPLQAGQDRLTPCSETPPVAEALARLNAMRDAGAPCQAAGSPPLAWDERLSASAQAQAADLAQRDEVSHVDAQQRALGARLQAVGYRLLTAAENLAAGQRDFEATLQAWLASPAHCANLMQGRFSQIGLACMQRSDSRYGRFWVAHFGAPRRR